MPSITYQCPLCSQTVKTPIKLSEPPRCANYEVHKHRRYVAMVEPTKETT